MVWTGTRGLRGVSLAAALGLGVAVLTVPAAAYGESGSQVEASAVNSSESIAKRNLPRVAGSPPRWVQRPYLVKKRNGRFALKGTVYVDPYRTATTKKAKRLQAKRDRVLFEVIVAKPRIAGSGRAVALLPQRDRLQTKQVKYRVDSVGLLKGKIGLGRKTSKKLRRMTKKQRRAVVALSVTHWKDTKPRSGAPWSLKQINTVELADRKLSKWQAKVHLKRVKRQARFDSRKSGASQSDVNAQWAGNSPMYNNVYVQNSSPFQQQVNINPNVQCMWTGANKNSQQASTQSVDSGNTLQFVYEYEDNSNSAWLGLNGATSYMDAPGTQGGLTADLVSSANAAGQNLFASAQQSSTYSGAGAVGAAADSALTFMFNFLAGLNSASTCNIVSTYPELFGVTTTVTGFGYNAAQDASNGQYSATNTWNGGNGVPAGSQGAVVPQSGTPWENFLTTTMQPLLGGTTTSNYYWNGGQPAPMVSNNVSGSGLGNYTGGSASYQGGLIQYVGQNPGNPGDAYCEAAYQWNCSYAGANGIPGDGSNFVGYNPTGNMTIQLAYLSNPDYQAGIFNAGNETPQVSVTNTDQGYSVSCDLGGLEPTLSTPFGANGTPTTVQGASIMQSQVNGSGQLPIDGNWLVNFFGVDANGEFVYYAPSLNSTSGEVTTPYLAPNAANENITIQAAATSGQGAVAVGTVYADDVGNMSTIDGTPSTPVAFGCTATPSVTLPGLDITGSNQTITQNFGSMAGTSGWPMPGNHTGWPSTAFTPYNSRTNYQWQWPVNQINVSFQGTPVNSKAAIPPNN